MTFRLGESLATEGHEGMITRISGLLEGMTELSAVVLPGGAAAGIAYQVLVPAYLAPKLTSKVGQPITLMTLHYLDSPNQGATFAPRLIGFETPREREFFELFTTVKGIGNRKALKAMAIEPSAIAAAIVAKDARTLTKLPEIGKRLAETVIAELSGKVEAFLPTGEIEHLDRAARNALPKGDLVVEEAVDALVALGEQRMEAERLVGRALERAKAKPSTSTELVQLVYQG
jgi:holliday junction DNA helicase RuvA